MFAYGFAVESNPYDSVAVSLTAGVHTNSAISSTSTHYIERNGVIPEVFALPHCTISLYVQLFHLTVSAFLYVILLLGIMANPVEYFG